MKASLIINNDNLRIDDIWYHYKRCPIDYLTYNFFIDYAEEELIRLIESYSGKSITDDGLQQAIIDKDEKNHSLGLFWYINNYFESNTNEKLNYDWKYVVHNIKEVILGSNGLIIKGQATPYSVVD